MEKPPVVTAVECSNFKKMERFEAKEFGFSRLAAILV